VSFSAADSYDLDGDKLTYGWRFGDGGNATGQAVRHTYASAQAATVTLTVRDQLGAQDVVTTTVHPANHSPVVTLTAPARRRYAVGDTVKLQATARDPEDGDLTVTWRSDLRHCPFTGSCHVHPGGTTRGSSYNEEFPDHGADTVMRVSVTATDSQGASTSRSYLAEPDLRTLAVNSPVAVTIDGSTVTSAEVVVGARVRVDAPRTSAYWRFAGWSDRGAAAHSFRMPSRDLTLTAGYRTAIEEKQAALGAGASPVGPPAGPEYDVPGGRGRDYARGRILWSPATGAHEVHGKILAAFLSTGGVGASGFPTTDEIAVTGGRASYFTRARIYHSAASGTHSSHGRLLAKYLAAGGPDRYGLPTTDDTVIRGGYFAGFTGGRSIYYSRATGAHLVFGAIRRQYGVLGYERSCLGFPTTDEYAVDLGRRNRFVGGQITWNATTHKTTAQCRPRSQRSAQPPTRPERSGAAEGPVGAEVLRGGGGIALEAGTLVERGGDGVEQAVQRVQVAAGRGVEGLLDQVVARDVDGVDAVHRLALGSQGAPPLDPGVDPRQVEEQAAHGLGVAAGGLGQPPEEGGVVDAAGLEQGQELLHQG
jgi:hypothetical protein